MPPAAAIGVGLGSAYLGSQGAKDQQDSQNAMYKNAAAGLSPNAINNASRQLNPWLAGALNGSYDPNNQYSMALYNMAQNPGYIDPSVMSNAYRTSNQQGQADLSRAMGMLGRQTGAQSSGGVSNAYALANNAAQSSRDADTMQKYNLWREQQKRADIAQLQQMWAQTQGQASQNAGGSANMMMQQQAPQNSKQGLGNMGSGALAAYGGMGGKGGGGGVSAPSGGQGPLPWFSGTQAPGSGVLKPPGS